jgi:hypothetical protein
MLLEMGECLARPALELGIVAALGALAAPSVDPRGFSPLAASRCVSRDRHQLGESFGGSLCPSAGHTVSTTVRIWDMTEMYYVVDGKVLSPGDLRRTWPFAGSSSGGLPQFERGAT